MHHRGCIRGPAYRQVETGFPASFSRSLSSGRLQGSLKSRLAVESGPEFVLVVPCTETLDPDHVLETSDRFLVFEILAQEYIEVR